MNSQSAALLGEQRPRIHKVPIYASTSGHDFIELYESTGERLDPWQKLVLIDGCGELPSGKWAAFEVATVVPRQNGKGTIIEAREIGGLRLLGEENPEHLMIHSAHEFKTCLQGFRRVKNLIDNTDDLRRKVKKILEGGERGFSIEFLNGARCLFVARTRGSARGFSADDLFLDEAYELDAENVGAMLPTLSARTNPQVWYFSSAPLRDSSQLRKVVKRGRSEGPARRLAYFEWSAPRSYMSDLDSIEALRLANPGLGIRLSLEFSQTERDAMGDLVYARERLGIEEETEGSSVIDMRVWDMLAEKIQHADPLVLAFDMDNDREHAAISVASRTESGLVYVELIESRAGHPYWLVDRIEELKKRHKPIKVVVNGNSPANTEITKLEDKKIEVYRASAAEMATACGQFYDHFRSDPEHEPTGRHAPHKALRDSVEGGRKRELGDGWAWARKDVTADISPVVSATLAMWGIVTFAKKRRGAPPMAAWV